MAEKSVPGGVWIAGQIVEFLSTNFSLPKSLFQPATSMKAAVGLNQDALQALAAVLTALPFMRVYGAVIGASDIEGAQTVADLIRIIRRSLAAKTAPAARSRKTPVKKKTAAKKRRVTKGAPGPRLPPARLRAASLPPASLPSVRLSPRQSIAPPLDEVMPRRAVTRLSNQS